MGPAARPPLRRPRPALEWLAVALGALLLAGALTWAGDDQLRGDQQAYNLLVARTLDPTLLARDALYGHDPKLLHVPWFLALHAAVARRLGGDVPRALAWLTWPMGTLYLVGHYALFRAATGSPAAAALAAVGALTVRNALGGEFWGFDGVRSAATRTILAALTPLLLLLFVAWRRRRDFPLFFLLLGGLFNVHPVSAYHLAQATALAHVILERFRRRALVQVAIGVVLFGLASLPYLVPFSRGRDDAADPATLALARAALDERFPYLFYPIAPSALLSVAFHVALLAAAWLWWRRGREANAVMAPLVVVMAAALGLGLGGTAVIQAVGVWQDRPYLDIQQLRAVRLVYPVLLTGLALAYARLLAGDTWPARLGVAALLAASLVPPGEVIHAVSEERRVAVKRALGMAAPPPPAAAAAADARPALWAWARATTDRDSLFFTDDFEFRLRTRRAITGSRKDGALMFLAGTRPFTRWYRLDREVRACRAAAGRDCWFPLARRLGADYAVVDPGVRAAAGTPDFVRVWERDGWSVWRRAGGRSA
jgi:hypothetical protein